MDRNIQHSEVVALLRHVLGRAHVLVDILQNAGDADEAVAAISAEFAIPVEHAVIVLDQQFSSLLRYKPAAGAQ